MKTFIGKLKVPIVKSLFLLTIGMISVQAQVIKDGHCWNERIGWIDMSGVDVDPSTHIFSGSATFVDGNYNGNGFENGEIGFTPQAGTNLQINVAQNKDANGNYAITGQAFSEQIGWVVADHSANAPAIVKSNGELGGNFWSDEFGWIQCDTSDIGSTNGTTNAQIWSLADVVVSDTNITVDENEGTKTFNIHLASQPATTVVIDIALSGTTEASINSSQLIFNATNWNQNQTVTVTGIDDNNKYADDSAIITIKVNDASSDDPYDIVVDKNITVTLHNDDVLKPTAAPDLISDTGSSTSDNLTMINTPKFTVKCTDINNSITLYVDGTATATTHTCVGTGDENLTADVLSDGVHDISYTQSIANVGESAQSDALAMTVDTLVPSSAITSPVDGFNEKNNTPIISGTKEQNSSIVVKDENNNTLCTVAANSSSTWSCTVTSSLADGAIVLNAVGTDVAGNSATSLNITVNIDTTKPTTPTAPTAASHTNSTTPKVTGSCIAGNTVTLYDNGVAITPTVPCDANGTFSFTPNPALVEGEHTLTNTETDIAGNESSQSTATTVNIDTTPPVTVTTPPSVATGTNTNDTNDTTPTITGTCTAGNTVTAYDNGVAITPTVTCDANGTFSLAPVAPGLSEGEHNLTTTETDVAGNESSQSTATTVNVDTTKPTTPTINEPIGLSISGTGEVGATVTATTPSGATCTAVVKDDGTYMCTLSPVPVDGESISLVQTDISGNTSSTNTPTSTIDAIVPTTPGIPTVAGAPFTLDNTPTISGSCTDGDVIVAYVDGNAIEPSTICVNGGFDITPTTPLADGEHTIHTVATDPSGNHSDAGESLTLTVGAIDSDNDGLPDIIDPNPNNSDSDNDGIPDGADADIIGPDTDGDGINDRSDADVDGDGIIDAGKQDSDGDGIADAFDTLDNTNLWYEIKVDENNGDRTVKHKDLESSIAIGSTFTPNIMTKNDEILVSINQEDVDPSNIDDTTTGETCKNVTYKAYANIYKDGKVSTGYTRVSVQCMELTKADPTATSGFKFAPGTKARLREPSSKEKEQYGNVNIVIVDDIVLEENDLTIGEI
jgi:hypothetical protein